MPLDEQLDEALKRLPTWTPPARFAARVVAAAGVEVRARPHPVLAREWGSYAASGAIAAGLAWALGAAGWPMLDAYLRLMTTAAAAAMAEPLLASWMCGALSLTVAAVATRQAL